MSEFAKLLKERDDQFRLLKGMPSLVGKTPETHFAMTVKEQAIPEAVITDGKKCLKCGQNSVISYQVQHRAGDEGTNTLYRCTNKSCGNTTLKQ